MNIQIVIELIDKGMKITDGDPDKEGCEHCQKCNEGSCELLGIFEQLKLLIDKD